MNKYAIIKDGVVDNIVLWDGKTPYDPGKGCVLVDLAGLDAVGIGDTFDGKTFTPGNPEPADPLAQALGLFESLPLDDQIIFANQFMLAKHYGEKGDIGKVQQIVMAVVASSSLDKDVQQEILAVLEP